MPGSTLSRAAAVSLVLPVLGAPSLALVLGLICALVGGELFVKGAVSLARWARVPAGIVASTVAAFATSGPELTVALTSGFAGVPEISLGDALGSNIVNVGLLLGIALLFGPIYSPRGAVARDFRVAFAQPILVAVFAADGILSRFDAVILLWLFAAWVGAVIYEGWQSRKRSAVIPPHGTAIGSTCILLIVGLLFLFAAGKLIVLGARGVAETWGMSEFVVGAVIVAVGTGIPELATMMMARLRGFDEIGIGTIVGSNIFNGMFIVPVAALLSPIRTTGLELTLLFGFMTLACAYPAASGMIGRSRAPLLLGLYAAFVWATLLFGIDHPQ